MSYSIDGGQHDDFVFEFRKKNNMSFVKSVYYFLIDFILGAQYMIYPKLLCPSHNQHEIPPALSKYLTFKRVY